MSHEGVITLASRSRSKKRRAETTSGSTSDISIPNIAAIYDVDSVLVPREGPGDDGGTH